MHESLRRCCCSVQEELYSYVTVAEDQTFKNKGTVIVEDD